MFEDKVSKDNFYKEMGQNTVNRYSEKLQMS